jgi:hypothetical protein
MISIDLAERASVRCDPGESESAEGGGPSPYEDVPSRTWSAGPGGVWS